MVTYYLNWMALINEDWIKENGDCWCAGRIDVRDDTKEGYDGWDEYSVPPMSSESWTKLSDWLDNLETSEVIEFSKLIEMFEMQTRHNIVWHKCQRPLDQQDKSR